MAELFKRKRETAAEFAERVEAEQVRMAAEEEHGKRVTQRDLKFAADVAFLLAGCRNL